MTSYTIDAALDIAVSATLPATFPYYFGPIATLLKNRDNFGNTSMPVTATATATMTNATKADVQLKINAGSTHPGSFPVEWPYQFPYNSTGAPPQATVTMQADIATTTSATVGFDTIGSNHLYADAPLASLIQINTGTGYPIAISASLPVTAARTASMHHNANAAASQNVTAAFSAKVKAGWHTQAVLAATASRTASTAFHAFASAHLTTVASPAASIHYGAHAVAGVTGRAATAAGVNQHAKISAPLPITVGMPTIVGKAFFASASLDVSIYANFPYNFPFIFEQSFDTISRGQSINAALPVSASPASSAQLNHATHTTVPITASFYALMLQGFEYPIAASLTVTAATSASMTRGRSISASQTITATRSATVSQFARIAAALPVVFEFNALANYATYTSASLVVTAETQAVTNLSGLIAAALPVAIGINPTSGIEWSADAELNAAISTQTKVSHGSTMGATLAIRAIMNATSPTATGFWPFYL